MYSNTTTASTTIPMGLTVSYGAVQQRDFLIGILAQTGFYVQGSPVEKNELNKEIFKQLLKLVKEVFPEPVVTTSSKVSTTTPNPVYGGTPQSKKPTSPDEEFADFLLKILGEARANEEAKAKRTNIYVQEKKENPFKTNEPLGYPRGL